MRKIIAILALTTAIFAGSTLYYARELARERESKAAVPAATGGSHPVLDSAIPVKVETAHVAAGAPAPEPGKAAAVAPKSAQEKPKLAPADLQFLEWAADPAKRRRMLDEQKMNLRRMNQGMDRALGLNTGEYERLLELMAEQRIHGREIMLQCAQSPDCDQARVADLRSDQALELTTLLGPERKQRLDEFLETAGERMSVRQLRGRLADTDHLSDGQADVLVRALSDERNRVSSEMAGLPNGPSMTFDGIPFVVSASSSFDDYMEQARAYQARMHRRAAEVLTPAQLAVFDQMAAERLNTVRYMVEATVPALAPR